MILNVQGETERTSVLRGEVPGRGRIVLCMLNAQGSTKLRQGGGSAAVDHGGGDAESSEFRGQGISGFSFSISGA